MSLNSLFACAALAAGLLYSETTPVELQPGKSIDLRPALAKAVPDFGPIHAFSVTGDTVHLFVRPKLVGAGPFTVVRLDLAGNVKRVVDLGVMMADPRWFYTEERTGDSYVWKPAHPTRPNPRETIYRIAADGRVEEAAAFDARLQAPAKLGSTIWGLTNSMCLPAGTPCNLSNSDPSARAGIFLPFSDTELISIEPIIPAVIRVNPSTGHVISRRVIAPEVLHAQSRARTNPAGVLVLPSYTVAQGSVWAIAMGQPMAKGAAILRLNGDGDVQESLRCELAKDDAFVNRDNPEGYMFSSAIGVSGGKLYILDARGMLSVCALSPRT